MTTAGRTTRSWNDTIRPLPGAHVLQTEEWGDFKQRTTGWQPDKIMFKDQFGAVVGAAMTLTRRLGPLAMMYVPRGPMLDYTDPLLLNQALERLEARARQNVAIQLKIDPGVIIGTGVPGEPDAAGAPGGELVMATLRKRGWRPSAEQVQFRNTITVDLTRGEDDLLAAMGQGKRRKVRYGPKHGVTVRAATLDDLPLLYRLYAETGKQTALSPAPMNITWTNGDR